MIACVMYISYVVAGVCLSVFCGYRLKQLNTDRAQVAKLSEMREAESEAVADLLRKKRDLEKQVRQEEERLSTAKQVLLEHQQPRSSMPQVDRSKKPANDLDNWKQQLSELSNEDSREDSPEPFPPNTKLTEDGSQRERSEQIRQAEERRWEEEQARKDAEQRKRQIELDRQIDEAERDAEIKQQKQREEAKREAELQRQKEQAKRDAELQKQREQAEREAELQQQREQAMKEAELRRQREQEAAELREKQLRKEAELKSIEADKQAAQKRQLEQGKIGEKRNDLLLV